MQKLTNTEMMIEAYFKRLKENGHKNYKNEISTFAASFGVSIIECYKAYSNLYGVNVDIDVERLKRFYGYRE